MPEQRKQLMARVTALIDRCQSVDFQVPVDTGFFKVDPELVRRILDLFDETARLLREIGDVFEDEIDGPEVGEISAADEADFLREIGASISTELATREVADLAFMGCSEVTDVRGDLQAAFAEGSLWKIAAHADAGLGRASRALIPIESALREYEGLPAMRRRFENLQDSLEIRRQYGMLWRALRRAGEPADEAVDGELRRVANRIAILRRLKIYPFLRIDDRLAIRRLQKRILARIEGSSKEPGRRLWSDAVAFFGLLKQVNNRHELRAHDRQLVLSVDHELRRRVAEGAADDGEIPAATLERLEPLLGRDDELDQVLRRPADHRIADCLAHLARLRDELVQAETPAPVTL